MMTKDLPVSHTAETWRRGSGLISFHLVLPSRQRPAEAMARFASWMIDHAPMIGEVRDVSLSTLSDGEDVITWRAGNIDKYSIEREIAARPDAARVMFGCDLLCRDIDDAEIRIRDGMTTYVELASLDRPDPAAPLELTLILDTDIYAATSWAATRDNHVLAERNAPAFNRFLHDLTITAGASLTGVDAPDYRGQVGPGGFVSR